MTKKHNVDRLETDFSLALLHAASLAYNNKELISFIQFIYKRQNDRNSKDNYKYNYTTLHICSSHLQKTVLSFIIPRCETLKNSIKNKITEIIKKKEIRR